MISKSINELDVKIFEYEYTIYKTGTNGRRYPVQASQTVFRFQSQRMNLPGFVLSPESILDKIEDVFGYYQDIDFQQHPAFSRRYLLTGDNEAAIRKLFTPAVLSHFASKRGRCVWLLRCPYCSYYNRHWISVSAKAIQIIQACC